MTSSHAQEGHDPDGQCWCFPRVVSSKRLVESYRATPGHDWEPGSLEWRQEREGNLLDHRPVD